MDIGHIPCISVCCHDIEHQQTHVFLGLWYGWVRDLLYYAPPPPPPIEVQGRPGVIVNRKWGDHGRSILHLTKASTHKFLRISTHVQHYGVEKNSYMLHNYLQSRHRHSDYNLKLKHFPQVEGEKNKICMKKIATPPWNITRLGT